MSEHREIDDPLRAARGILCGMVLGSIMWVVIIAVIAWACE